MERPSLAIFLSALALSMPARAAPPSKEATPDALAAPTSPVADSARVKEHVSRGDKARRASRWTDAIEAYEAALLAAERAGLSLEERYSILAEIVICEVARGNYALAGNRLFQFEYQFPENKPDPQLRQEQRTRLDRAYNKLLSKAARALIFVDPPEAKVYLDGNLIINLDGPRPKLYIDWIFVEPGEHDLSAQLVGHGDISARANFVGGQLLSFNFKLERPRSEPRTRRSEPREPAGRSTAPTPEPREPSGRGASLFRGLETMSLGMGLIPLVGFGVSPGTNIGVSVDGIYRTGGISFNAEIRITGSQVMEGEDGIRTIRGGGNLSTCGHLNVTFFCGLAGWSIIDGLPGTHIKLVETDEPVAGSFGLRSGIEWRFNDRLALRTFGEVSYTMGQPSVWINHVKYWAAPPIAGILGLGFVVPMADNPRDKATAPNHANVADYRGM